MTSLKAITAVAAFLALVACEKPPHAGKAMADTMESGMSDSMDSGMSDGDAMMSGSN